MIDLCRTIDLKSPDETAALAMRLGALLHPGDCLLLDGPIGAGKTHFARHLIQSLLNHPEDVPSPTFTLVQTYETRSGELWHADLYRLTSPDEIEELGLVDAFDTAICLVEWPDKLGSLRPNHALTLSLSMHPEQEDSRRIDLSWRDDKWARRIPQLSHD